MSSAQSDEEERKPGENNRRKIPIVSTESSELEDGMKIPIVSTESSELEDITEMFNEELQEEEEFPLS